MIQFVIAQYIFLALQIVCVILFVLSDKVYWNWLNRIEGYVGFLAMSLCIPNILCMCLYYGTKS